MHQSWRTPFNMATYHPFVLLTLTLVSSCCAVGTTHRPTHRPPHGPTHGSCTCEERAFIAFSVRASGVKQGEDDSSISYDTTHTKYSTTGPWGGLDSSTMKFEAPVDGIYVFSATAMTGDDGVVPLTLRHNGDDAMWVGWHKWDDMGAPLQGSNQVMLTLRARDVVELIVPGHDSFFTSSFHDPSYVSFMGYLEKGF